MTPHLSMANSKLMQWSKCCGGLATDGVTVLPFELRCRFLHAFCLALKPASDGGMDSHAARDAGLAALLEPSRKAEQFRSGREDWRGEKPAVSRIPCRLVSTTVAG
jgi:hypothetical protein